MLFGWKLCRKLILLCAVSASILLTKYMVYSVVTFRKYLFRCKVKKLIIYPIKSLPGIEVDEISFEDYLPKYKKFYDRSWILIDEEGKNINLRTEPRLSKIKVNFLEDELELKADQMPTLIIPNSPPLKSGDLIHTVSIWGTTIDGQDQGVEINNWFSTFLKYKVTLLKHHVKFGYRPSKKLINNELHQISDRCQQIIYNDGFPLLVINERSVQDLNDHIKEENNDNNQAYVTSNRFRANVLFNTDKAFEEDNWKFMKIGNLEFEFILECSRCRLTTLNLDTLEYENEPLRTLKKYRMGPEHIFKGAPKIGVYFKVLKNGKIRVGDSISACFE